jgi:hypothetical protein
MLVVTVGWVVWKTFPDDFPWIQDTRTSTNESRAKFVRHGQALFDLGRLTGDLAWLRIKETTSP